MEALTGIPLPPAVRSSTPMWCPLIGRVTQLRSPIAVRGDNAPLVWNMLSVRKTLSCDNIVSRDGSTVAQTSWAFASSYCDARHFSLHTKPTTTRQSVREAYSARANNANRSTKGCACRLAPALVRYNRIQSGSDRRSQSWWRMLLHAKRVEASIWFHLMSRSL